MMMFRRLNYAAAAAIVAIGALAAAPDLRWIHAFIWTALALLTIAAVLKNELPGAASRWPVIAALAVSTATIVLTGGFSCWSMFSAVCLPPPPLGVVSWGMVFVNQDTFTYLEKYTSLSLRPPLYDWFAHAITLFQVTSAEFVREARSLIQFEVSPELKTSKSAILLQHLSETAPHLANLALLKVARAQQIALWGAAMYFVWSASRVIPAIVSAVVVLALYDGGYLSHWYFARAVESKTLYLAFFFAAAAASLDVMRRPASHNVLLTSVFGSAMVLTRPQGLIALLLVILTCVKALATRTDRLASRVALAMAALAIFVIAAAFPSAVTYFSQGVLQPSNIYAMSRIPFALEVATASDIDRMPDEFTREYLEKMLEMKAASSAPKPTDIYAAIHQNQAIAMSACDIVGRKHLEHFTLICANAMMSISDVVLGQHYITYLSKIVFPALKRLTGLHVGGGFWLFPWSLIAASFFIALLGRSAPWLAAWGATITALHWALLLMLAMFAGPYPGYFYTSEPVLLITIAVMIAKAACTRRVFSVGAH